MVLKKNSMNEPHFSTDLAAKFKLRFGSNFAEKTVSVSEAGAPLNEN